MQKCLISLLLLVGCFAHGQDVPPEARELFAQQPFLTSSPDVISNPESLHILFNDTVFGGVVSHVLSDFHGAEVRAAHGAEMRSRCRVPRRFE